MKTPQHIEVLKESLDQMRDAMKWLKHSINVCSPLSKKELYSTEEYDALESLASRFARSSDILFQKVFRSIDRVELEDSGTLLDALNKAEKRGLIESVDIVREYRELRNRIAHEYVHGELLLLFKTVLKISPRLLEIGEKTEVFCHKYISPTAIK